MRKFVRAGLAVLVLCIAGVMYAQEDGETHTFDNGVQFTIPQSGELDTSGQLPTVSLGEAVLIEVIQPGVMGATEDVTLDLPLSEVLDFLLGIVGYEGTREDAFTFVLSDGREAMVLDFVNANANNIFQSILVIRMSDGRVGALNIRSLEELGTADRAVVLELAASFDVNTDDETVSRFTAAEMALMAGLTQSHTYESGVTFSYPEDYVVNDPDATLLDIGLPQQIIITVVDPNVMGVPPNETMESMIDFAIRGTEISASSFEPLDIGRREAVIGSGPSDQFVNTLVLVRFDDGTVGILDILTVAELEGDLLLQVRGLAASFNSATDEFTGRTREAFEQSRALFEEAMGLRDEGELEGAIDLLTQALALDDEYTLAYYWRAVSYHGTGQLENALADYQLALEHEPDEVQINNDIAEVYVMMDDLDAAVAAMEALIEARGIANLSETERLAYDMYQRIAAGEFIEDFYFGRANLYSRAGLYEEALRDNQLVIDNNPDDATLYAQRGVIYMNMEQPSDAVTTFTAGLRIELDPILFYNRGFAHQANIRGNIDSLIDAVHDFQCVILLADDSITSQQVTDAQRAITRTIIQSDSYQPITDAADCLP